MATVSQLKDEIARYWVSDREHSFCNLHNRAMACANRMDKLRKDAIGDISRAFEMPDNLSIVLNQKRAVLRDGVEELRKIEEALGPAFTLAANSSVLENGTVLMADYTIFKQRAHKLATDIGKVYRDSLYPFLQVLQNGESGWNPAGIVCKLSNYLWPASDPRKEIEKMFPKMEEIPPSGALPNPSSPF